MTPAQKCRLAVAMTALAAYAGCGDTTIEEAAPAVAHEVPKANYAYPRPEPSDVTAGLDRRVQPPRAARSRPRPAPASSSAPRRSGTGKPRNLETPRHNPSLVGSDMWARLAQCESGGNPRAVSSTGKYRGAFQFSLATWLSVGMSGDPINHTYAEQLAAAQKLQARSGFGQWPACARKLGLQ